MKPSGILNFENVPADAGDPDVKVYVNGSEVEIGGGGDSDFTIAVVTINNTGETDLKLLASYIVGDDIDILPNVPVDDDDTTELQLILYKGSLRTALLTPDQQILKENIATTGSIEASAEGMLTITGDGTITVGE